MRIIKLVTLSIIVVSLTACSYFSSNKDEYKNSTSSRPLEAPPALVIPEVDGGYKIPGQGVRVSESTQAVKQSEKTITKSEKLTTDSGVGNSNNGYFERDGKHWIHLNKSVNSLWGPLVDFWREKNFKFEKQDKALGIIQTKWSNPETRDSQGGLQSIFKTITSSVAGSNRERYLVAISESAGETDIYLIQENQEKVLSDKESDISEDTWESLPENENRVASTLKLLYESLVTENIAAGNPKATPASTKITESKKGIKTTITRPVTAVWSSVLRYWDEQNIKIDERDREAGLLKTVWFNGDGSASRKGLFASASRLFSDERIKYKITIIETSSGTDIFLRSENQEKTLSDGANREERIPSWQDREANIERDRKRLKSIQEYIESN